MSDFLPKEVRAELEIARQCQKSKKERLCVRADGAEFPVQRIWENGFALEGEDAPRLRGFVDLYSGARHLYSCLIVASHVEEGEICYDFKRHTPASATAPLDFYADPEAPIALLER